MKVPLARSGLYLASILFVHSPQLPHVALHLCLNPQTMSHNSAGPLPLFWWHQVTKVCDCPHGPHWEFDIHFLKDTYTIEAAMDSLMTAEICQRKSRPLGFRASLTQVSADRKLEQDEADLNMGCLVFFLQANGYPVVVCTASGHHHVHIDKGIFSHSPRRAHWQHPFQRRPLSIFLGMAL